MKIGFTGTQHGMTVKQKNEVWFWLGTFMKGIKNDAPAYELHHGGCIGADAQVHEILIGVPRWFERHVHWAIDVDDSKVAKLDDLNDSRVYDPLPPLERNRIIVDTCDVLIAAPRQRKEEQRSGTWATIRYARKQGKTTIMVWP